MDALRKCFELRLSTVRVKTQHAITFLGPVPDFAGGGQICGAGSHRTRCPTTCVAEPLRLSQVCLAPPQRFFRLLCRGDVHRGPDKFYEVARLVQDRMAGRMEVFDRSVRKNDAVVHLKVGFLDFGFFKEVYNTLAVLRMELIKEEFRVRWVIIRLDVVYPIDFRGECDCPRCNLMSRRRKDRTGNEWL